MAYMVRARRSPASAPPSPSLPVPRPTADDEDEDPTDHDFKGASDDSDDVADEDNSSLTPHHIALLAAHRESLQHAGVPEQEIEDGSKRLRAQFKELNEEYENKQADNEKKLRQAVTDRDAWKTKGR